MKNILITGGAGFIGSHLADELLAYGYHVRVLDNLSPQIHGPEEVWPSYLSDEVERLKGDVRDAEAVRRALSGIDAVFHLAAAVGVGQSMYEVAAYTETNNMGTAVLLEALTEQPVGRLIAASDVDDRYLKQANWAVQQYDLPGQVTAKKQQVYDFARQDDTYDLVLFLGVLYHLRYPLLALDIVTERTHRLLAFQSLSLPDADKAPARQDRSIDDREPLLAPGWPKMAFIEEYFAGDPTNWRIPNPTAAEAMLRSSGLRIVHRPGPEIFLCEPAPEASADETCPFVREQLQAATGRP